MKFVLVQREVVPRPGRGRGRVGVGSGLVLNLMTAQLRLSRSISSMGQVCTGGMAKFRYSQGI